MAASSICFCTMLFHPSSPITSSKISLSLSITAQKPPSFRGRSISVVGDSYKEGVTYLLEKPTTFNSRYAPDKPAMAHTFWSKPSSIRCESSLRLPRRRINGDPSSPNLLHHNPKRPSSSRTMRNLATEDYVRFSGKPGICIATSSPGAMNLVSGLADTLFDSVTLIAITGQIPRRMIGTMAFQETPVVEVTKTITKHNYIVMDVEEIPRIVQEVFFLATSVRPGQVLIDIPKDVQQQLAIPN